MSLVDISVLNEMNSTDLIRVELNKGPFERRPGEFYYSPFTLKDQQEISKMSGGNHLESLVCTLIHKAVDENGKKIYAPGNKAQMMRLDADLITEMIDAMNKAGRSRNEDAAGDPEKN